MGTCRMSSSQACPALAKQRPYCVWPGRCSAKHTRKRFWSSTQVTREVKLLKKTCLLGFTDYILGIDVVRNRIKGFAQKKVTLPPGRQKIVILDEADRYVRGPV